MRVGASWCCCCQQSAHLALNVFVDDLMELERNPEMDCRGRVVHVHDKAAGVTALVDLAHPLDVLSRVDHRQDLLVCFELSSKCLMHILPRHG